MKRFSQIFSLLSAQMGKPILEHFGDKLSLFSLDDEVRRYLAAKLNTSVESESPLVRILSVRTAGLHMQQLCVDSATQPFNHSRVCVDDTYGKKVRAFGSFGSWFKVAETDPPFAVKQPSDIAFIYFGEMSQKLLSFFQSERRFTGLSNDTFKLQTSCCVLNGNWRFAQFGGKFVDSSAVRVFNLQNLDLLWSPILAFAFSAYAKVIRPLFNGCPTTTRQKALKFLSWSTKIALSEDSKFMFIPTLTHAPIVSHSVVSMEGAY